MKEKIKQFFTNPRNLYILGFILVFALSFSEVMRGKQRNFMIFSEATQMFWNGINPYLGQGAWENVGLDYYIYGPLFNIFFAPFAFLPDWMGPFVWNLFNFTLLFISIFTLPKKYSNEQKCKTFLYTFLILATTQLSFQYNVTVAYLFIFSFSLMEKGKSFWAIALILFSGFTKIYGIFQLGFLLCYPKFWRNMGYVLIIALIFTLLPALKIPIAELSDYYQTWFDALTSHEDDGRTWATFFYMKPFFHTSPSYMRYIQIATISSLAILLILNYKKYINFEFRAQALGILMGWVILFSDTSEKHTYVIALLGYLIWYWTISPKKRLDKILFWANFIILTVVPVDLLCPSAVMKFICNTLTFNIWLFTFTWLRMCYLTLVVNCFHGNKKVFSAS